MSGTNYIASNWRVPENSNSSKNDNYSLSFDPGGFEYIDCSTDVFTSSVISSMSISIWIKTTVGTANAFICKDAQTSGNRNFLFQLSASDLFWQTSTDGSTFQNLSVANTTVDLLDGEWHHIVGTYESGATSGTAEKKIYIDGILRATDPAATLSDIVNTLSVPVEIGRRGDGLRYFDGDISEAVIFDYALTQDQVNTLHGDATSGAGNPMALKPTPVAYYPLGDNSSGDPVTQPNVSVDDASVFNTDATNYIPIGDVLHQDGTTPFSISAWIKCSTNGDFNIISKRRCRLSSSGLYPGFSFILDTSGVSNNKLLFELQNKDASGSTSGTLRIKGNGFDYNDNQWHHVAVTYDGSGDVSGVLFYKDGEEYSAAGLSYQTLSNNLVGAIPNYSTVDLSIGGDLSDSTCSGTLTRSFIGDLSNIAMFETELTAVNIQSIYNNGVPGDISALNPAAWYKLDQSANWEADTSGNWQIPDAVSAYPQSFSFNGTNQYVPIGTTSLGITSAITVSAWVKIPTTNTGGPAPNIQEFICEDATGGSNRNWGLFWRHLSVSNKNFYFLVWHTNGSSTTVQSTGIVPNDGNWHHIMGTFDGTTDANGLKLYVDGTLFQTTAGSTGIRSSSGVAPAIGAIENGNGYRFEGNISNTAIWDSVQNIDDIYNSGTPATSYSGTPTAWWKLDDTATFSTNWTVPDASGNGNNGTSSGMTEQSLVNNNVSTLNGESSGMTSGNLVLSDLTRNLPYENYSMDFGGTNYITINSSTQLDEIPLNPYSISFWIKTTNSSSSKVISEKRATSTFTDAQYTVHLQSGSIYWYGGAGGTGSPLFTSSPINDGEWYHIVLVAESITSSKMYINGQLDGTNSGNRINSSSIVGTFNICANYIGDFDLVGNLSNYSIFNTDLTSTEVQKLYSNGLPQDLTNFTPKPVGWWTLGKESFWNGSDWIVRDMIGTNDGTSSNMAVSDLVGDAPRSEANGTGTNMDIPTNLVGNAGFSDKNAYSINMSPSARVTDTP